MWWRFIKPCRKRINGGSRPSRPAGWDVAESNMSPRCWIVRGERSNGEFTNSTSCRTIRSPVACGGPAAAEKKVETEPQLQENLKSVLNVRTAGDPDDAGSLWTDLSPRAIAETVTDLGTPVSAGVVRDWLEAEGLALHKIEKTIAGGRSPDRNTQFERIAELKAEYRAAGNPVFSIDTKAKEHLGHLYRAGRVRTQQAFRAFDHDFPSWADGVIIPHGIYDLARNRGHLNLGLSH